MARTNLLARMCAAGAIATLGTGASASMVLRTDQGALTAASASERSSSGQPQRASWDLATMKGARSAAPQPMTVTLEKVSVQDFHYVCPSKSSARAAGGGITAMDDWEAPACKMASATIEDGGKTYVLSDVTLVGRPMAGCDRACTTGSVEVSFMAINEKGNGGKNPPKASK